MAAKNNKSIKNVEEVSEILKVETGVLHCYVVGTSPLILNKMSEKAKHQLLLPSGRKTAVEKATTLKHDPYEEYRASAYTLSDESQPTFLALLATAFKGSLRSAALDMPGAKKAQIGRLTYIEGEMVGVYGVPKLFMTIVRSADMNRTPDVRTRAIVPEWACHLRVRFVQPLIRAQAVTNLLAAAGITIGVGDWRSEKGSGNYGQFALVSEDDATYRRIVKDGARDAQKLAIESPVSHDDETTTLLSWYDDERARRSIRGVA
jgi:hypothetical protein